MATVMLTRRELAALLPGAALAAEARTVVLTFDDAVKSHLGFVARTGSVPARLPPAIR